MANTKICYRIIRPNSYRWPFVAGIAVTLFASLSGCNGKLTTTVVDAVTLKPITLGTDGKPIKDDATPTKLAVTGIIAYRPIRLVKVSQFTQYDPGDKKPLSSNCMMPSLLVREVITVADTEHPIQIAYIPGLLEASEFGVVMSADGILLNVNDKSTPDQGKTIENLTAAASNIAKSGAAFQPSPTTSTETPQHTVCNATPTFRGYEQPPLLDHELPLFGKIQPESVLTDKPM